MFYADDGTLLYAGSFGFFQSRFSMEGTTTIKQFGDTIYDIVCFKATIVLVGSKNLESHPRLVNIAASAIPCDKDYIFHYVLCEKTLTKIQSNIEPPTMKSLNFEEHWKHMNNRYIKCANNQITHNFLSCDYKSDCGLSLSLEHCQVHSGNSLLKEGNYFL